MFKSSSYNTVFLSSWVLMGQCILSCSYHVITILIMGFLSWQTHAEARHLAEAIVCWRRSQKHPEITHPTGRKANSREHKPGPGEWWTSVRKDRGWPHPSVAMTLWCQSAPLRAPTALHARGCSALHFLLESNSDRLCFAPHPKGNCGAALGRSFPPMGGCHGYKWTEHTEHSGQWVLAIQMHL